MLASASFGSNGLTIYYIPFNVETYSPVTKATISCSAEHKWIITNTVTIGRLESILTNGSPAQFDSNRVRVKIVSNSETYYLDAAGVKTNKNESIKIDKIAFTRLLDSLSPNDKRALEPCG
jgi:hypothetical protein